MFFEAAIGSGVISLRTDFTYVAEEQGKSLLYLCCGGARESKVCVQAPGGGGVLDLNLYGDVPTK